MLYRYGVFAFIPYMVMIVCYFVKLVQSISKKWYIALCGVVLLAVSCVTDFELVFGNWYWILFYLCMGYFFSNRLGENKNAPFGSGR